MESNALPEPDTAGAATDPADRRATVRYPCDVVTACQRAPARVDDQLWPAVVRDLSAGGVGLVVSRWFGPGTVLEFELRGKGGVPVRMLVRVVHSVREAGGRWLVGCAFAQELPEEDLRNLL